MANRRRRPATPEQRAKAAEVREVKLAALHETMAEQVAALADGPEWRRWLDVAAKFHSYSFGNTVLLLAQRPDATQVAGYQMWQELGRQVNKGERGLMIVAPVTRRVDATESESSAEVVPAREAPEDVEPHNVRRVVGYRPAYLWDITQTSGDPLPSPPTPTLLAGQAPAGLWDALSAQCRAAGFTVSRQPIAGDAGPNGYTAFASRQVVVRSDVDDAQAAKTLAHELGHVLLHDPGGFTGGVTRGCRGAREVEAESVAYLVAAEHGLDTSGYTFAYVATWAAQAGDVDAVVRKTGARVLTAAHQILDTAHAAAAAVDAVEMEALTERASAGAERTAALRATLAPAGDAPERTRLVEANANAADFFVHQLPGSWAQGYLAERLGPSWPAVSGRVGCAPAGWTQLIDHLRGRGFTDTELLAAGLASRARTGQLIDRFRDRLMFPIHGLAADGSPELVGFVGRRHPRHDSDPDPRVPKYVNTSDTALYRKGEHLYGLAERRTTLARGGVAVVGEGPLDALAVELAAPDSMVGCATLGTALTDRQASALRHVLGDNSDRIVMVPDPDFAGHQAAVRAYDTLTRHTLDPRLAELPAGLDPADLARRNGPAELVNQLTAAEPMPRRLVAQLLDGQDRQWIEDAVRQARDAAAIIIKAPPITWQREIDAISAATGLDEALLRSTVVETIRTEADPLGRLTARDRREDLDRGQFIGPTAADIAALSAPRATKLQPTQTAENPAAARLSNGVRQLHR